MLELISSPASIDVPGGKTIEEFAGRVRTGDTNVSVARMFAPQGWEEPGQRPLFDEFTLVLEGTLRVESDDGATDVPAGQAIITRAGEWVRYSSPHAGGARYVAVCVPAFSPDTVHRDPESE